MALAPASSSSAIFCSRCRPIFSWNASARVGGSPASCSPGASCPARWPSLAANTASTSCACSWVLRKPGFFPGIIFYLTLWFPTLYRARIIGLFMAAIPGSTVFGAPLSSLLLYMDGIGGLKGWQWVFILEAAPAVILSFVVLYYLTDRPAEANWLEPDERKWLSDKLEEEQRQRVAAAHFTVGEALTNPRVLALAVVYFGAVATNYGISFWLPQIIKDFGNLSNLQ